MNTGGRRATSLSKTNIKFGFLFFVAYPALLSLISSESLFAVETYFIEEGVAFHAHETKGDFRQPLYRLIGPTGLHTFTTSVVWRDRLLAEGFKEEPSGIYVLSAAREGAKRLYQFVRTGEGRQVILTTSVECRNDLLSRPNEFEEIESECYVFPPEYNPSFERLSPVYCLRNPFADERMYVVSRSEIAAILGIWETRKKQLWREVVPVAEARDKDVVVQEIAPVGDTVRVGDLEWRFEEDKELGKELENGRSIKARGSGGFVCFHLRIRNVGVKPVPLRAPDALIGRPAGRLPISVPATEAHVKQMGLRSITGMTLAPGESVLAHCVYDIQHKTPHIVIEAYGGPSAPNTVILLDTGR